MLKLMFLAKINMDSCKIRIKLIQQHYVKIKSLMKVKILAKRRKIYLKVYWVVILL